MRKSTNSNDVSLEAVHTHTHTHTGSASGYLAYKKIDIEKIETHVLGMCLFAVAVLLDDFGDGLKNHPKLTPLFMVGN